MGGCSYLAIAPAFKAPSHRHSPVCRTNAPHVDDARPAADRRPRRRLNLILALLTAALVPNPMPWRLSSRCRPSHVVCRRLVAGYAAATVRISPVRFVVSLVCGRWAWEARGALWCTWATIRTIRGVTLARCAAMLPRSPRSPSWHVVFGAAVLSSPAPRGRPSQAVSRRRRFVAYYAPVSVYR
ncbi:hypothetical protein BJ912DRAFT_1009249, partial [Pholiota molesta]